MRGHLNLLREFSIPLLAGVCAALIWANVDLDSYFAYLHTPVVGNLNLHFVTNDLFMTLFFGIAAVEITQSCLPGGDLHPLKRAVNPLLATAGGVLGPVAVYLLLNALLGSPALTRGWGIGTATDIALAWLAARSIFGKGHPAISFLLLLAIADDAVGLAIIAIFYGDPHAPVQAGWLLLTALGMALCALLRRRRTMNYWPYLVVGGSLSWLGLYLSHLHPALALVFVIPFLPHRSREGGHLFEEDKGDISPLSRFERDWKLTVDLGLFMFGLVNGGVPFTSIGKATWLVLASLIGGKTLGVLSFGALAERLGFPLPKGMRWRELAVTGIVAGTGFTVALFVAGEAFPDPALAGGAKMGAMLSIFAFIPAVLVARGVKGKKAKA
jgi:NhaA family Na+:H+ antiporter